MNVGEKERPLCVGGRKGSDPSTCFPQGCALCVFVCVRSNLGQGNDKERGGGKRSVFERAVLSGRFQRILRSLRLAAIYVGSVSEPVTSTSRGC